MGGCIGCKKNEEKIIQVKFKAEYPQKILAGKIVKFKLRIRNIIPLNSIQEITGEMLNKLKCKSEDELNLKSENVLIRSFALKIRHDMKKQLFNAIDKYNLDLPDNIVEEEYRNIWNEFEKSTDYKRKLERKSLDLWQKEYKNSANRRVKLGLIMAKVAKDLEIQVNDSEVKLLLENQVIHNPENRENIMKNYQDRN